MTDPKIHFLGTWLHSGERRGQDFSHHSDQFDHEDDEGTTSMRHAFIEQEGQQVGVWVPSDWTDDQVREALESNW